MSKTHKRATRSKSDAALAALLSVRDSLKRDVPDALIESILDTEQTYQFDADRKAAIDQIDDLIEAASDGGSDDEEAT